MASNGYKDFFKTARDVKRGTMKGPRVGDVLKTLKARPKRRKNLPVTPLFTAAALLAGSLYAYNNVDALEKILGRIEIHAFGLAQAEGGSQPKAEKSSATKDGSKEKSSQEKSPAKAEAKAATQNWTPEQLAFFNKLEERKKQLDQREQELQKMEEELQEQRVALEKRLSDLEDIRTKISSRLDEKVKIDQEKVNKLVEFYSNMKPQNAAKIFEDIDEDLAVEILNKMKKKSAADIMNLLNAEKAQKLSEKFAGYKVTSH
jgi:flagellar motility protein MotE (MotC chaperone)